MGTSEKGILSLLKLDNVSLDGKFMYIEEFNNADGSFIIGSLVRDEIERGRRVVLVLCHSSLGHFQAISQKLGYNLTSLKDSGQVHVLDMMETAMGDNFTHSKDTLRTLYSDIKEKVNGWTGDQSVSIIIENIGNYLLINADDLIHFLHYLRVLIQSRAGSSLTCSLHSFSNCSDFDGVTKVIKHSADVVVVVKDLGTGRANDVTGHLTTLCRDNKFSKTKSEYHYLLGDKSIHVFLPGSNEFSFKR